ncbi:MAG: WD40 repeat domain-containing protein [Planctomycetaceae bacterium]|nr:WD40 repeat domain-containing protein [Planctomycetaceae bacterium]
MFFTLILPVANGCSLYSKGLRPTFSYTPSAGKALSPVETLALSQDQNYLVQGQHITSKEDEKIRGDVFQIWDISTGRSPALLFQTRGGANLAAAFTPDGKYLMACRNTGIARIRLSDKSTQVVTLNNPKVLSPLGDYVACMTEEGWVIHHTEDASFSTRLPQSVDRFLTFSKNGQFIAASLRNPENSEPGTTKIGLWSFGPEKLALQSEITIQQYAAPEKSCFSANGQQFAALVRQGYVGIWNAGTGQKIRELNEQSGTIRTIAFSPDGEFLAVGIQDVKGKKGGLDIWNVNNGKLVRKFEEKRAQGITAICFTANGDTVFAGNTNGEVQRYPINPD